MAAMSDERPCIAIFPWGEVIEEFLDPLDLTAEDFVQKMRGGWLFGYVSALQAQGWRPVIVYASEHAQRPIQRRHADTGVAIWLTPGRRSRSSGSPSLRAARQWRQTPTGHFRTILRHETATAVLVQEYESARSDAVALLATSMGLPVYATFQGGDVTLSPLERLVRPHALGLYDGLVVASARERKRVALRRRPPRMVNVPNPVDTTFWRTIGRDGAREALGIDPATPLVVNHGRIDIWRKGLDVLLEAWEQVRCKRPDARLVIIGAGQDQDAFRALIATHGAGVTWVSDYVTDPEVVRRWLSAADVYVTTSRVEGLPVAPLEAMSCGLPVVASEAHGLADIFSAGEASGGLLAPREDPAAAAAGLVRLLGDAELRLRLGGIARERACRLYGFDAVGAALSECFARREKPAP